MPEPIQSTAAWTTAFLSSAEQIEQDEAAGPSRSRDPSGPVELTVLGRLDHTLGDVSHPGPVTIRGDVEPDLTVHATGRIVVEGDVRGARLVSGDSIEVAGAVDGPGETTLDARGDVVVGSARHAHITAGGDLRVRLSLVQCDVTARGRVELPGELGQISGGTTRAGGGIRVSRLGSSRGRATTVVVGKAILGDDPGSLDARIRICSETAARTARRIDQRCAQFDALPEGRAPVVQEIRRLVGERTRTLRLQASLVRQRRQASARAPEADPEVRVDVVYPGVTLDVGGGPRPVSATTDPHPGGRLGD